jgi:hypothetical protein
MTKLQQILTSGRNQFQQQQQLQLQQQLQQQRGNQRIRKLLSSPSLQQQRYIAQQEEEEPSNRTPIYDSLKRPIHKKLDLQIDEETMIESLKLLNERLDKLTCNDTCFHLNGYADIAAGSLDVRFTTAAAAPAYGNPKLRDRYKTLYQKDMEEFLKIVSETIDLYNYNTLHIINTVTNDQNSNNKCLRRIFVLLEKNFYYVISYLTHNSEYSDDFKKKIIDLLNISPNLPFTYKKETYNIGVLIIKLSEDFKKEFSYLNLQSFLDEFVKILQIFIYYIIFDDRLTYKEPFFQECTTGVAAGEYYQNGGHFFSYLAQGQCIAADNEARADTALQALLLQNCSVCRLFIQNYLELTYGFNSTFIADQSVHSKFGTDTLPAVFVTAAIQQFYNSNYINKVYYRGRAPIRGVGDAFNVNPAGYAVGHLNQFSPFLDIEHDLNKKLKHIKQVLNIKHTKIYFIQAFRFYIEFILSLPIPSVAVNQITYKDIRLINPFKNIVNIISKYNIDMGKSIAKCYLESISKYIYTIISNVTVDDTYMPHPGAAPDFSQIELFTHFVNLFINKESNSIWKDNINLSYLETIFENTFQLLCKEDRNYALVLFKSFIPHMTHDKFKYRMVSLIKLSKYVKDATFDNFTRFLENYKIYLQKEDIDFYRNKKKEYITVSLLHNDSYRKKLSLSDIKKLIHYYETKCKPTNTELLSIKMKVYLDVCKQKNDLVGLHKIIHKYNNIINSDPKLTIYKYDYYLTNFRMLFNKKTVSHTEIRKTINHIKNCMLKLREEMYKYGFFSCFPALANTTVGGGAPGVPSDNEAWGNTFSFFRKKDNNQDMFEYIDLIGNILEYGTDKRHMDELLRFVKFIENPYPDCWYQRNSRADGPSGVYAGVVNAVVGAAQPGPGALAPNEMSFSYNTLRTLAESQAMPFADDFDIFTRVMDAVGHDQRHTRETYANINTAYGNVHNYTFFGNMINTPFLFYTFVFLCKDNYLKDIHYKQPASAERNRPAVYPHEDVGAIQSLDGAGPVATNPIIINPVAANLSSSIYHDNYNRCILVCIYPEMLKHIYNYQNFHLYKAVMHGRIITDPAAGGNEFGDTELGANVYKSTLQLSIQYYLNDYPNVLGANAAALKNSLYGFNRFRFDTGATFLTGRVHNIVAEVINEQHRLRYFINHRYFKDYLIELNSVHPDVCSDILYNHKISHNYHDVFLNLHGATWPVYNQTDGRPAFEAGYEANEKLIQLIYDVYELVKLTTTKMNEPSNTYISKQNDMNQFFKKFSWGKEFAKKLLINSHKQSYIDKHLDEMKIQELHQKIKTSNLQKDRPMGDAGGPILTIGDFINDINADHFRNLKPAVKLDQLDLDF